MDIDNLKRRVEEYRENRRHKAEPYPDKLVEDILTHCNRPGVKMIEVERQLGFRNGALWSLKKSYLHRKAKKKSSIDRDAIPRPSRVVHSGVNQRGKASTTASAESGFTVITPKGYKIEGLTFSQLKELTQ